MKSDLLHAIWLSAAFLALFVVSEFLYHRLKVKAELTRKLVHFGTGILTFLFPVFLSSHWWVLVLCSSFAIILIVSLQFGLLKSINAVDRKTWGSLCFPLAVYICFYIYEYKNHESILFYLPILILAVCDPLAALVGRKWPVGSFTIAGSFKTISGMAAFAITAFCITIPFFTDWHLSTSEVIGFSFAIATLSSVVEALSTKGFDNITVPLAVVLLTVNFI